MARKMKSLSSTIEVLKTFDYAVEEEEETLEEIEYYLKGVEKEMDSCYNKLYAQVSEGSEISEIYPIPELWIDDMETKVEGGEETMDLLCQDQESVEGRDEIIESLYQVSVEGGVEIESLCQESVERGEETMDLLCQSVEGRDDIIESLYQVSVEGGVEIESLCQESVEGGEEM